MNKLLLSAVLALGVSSAAQAANLDYDSYTWTGVDIHVTSPNNISGGAGPITLYNGATPLGTFWCMDVDNYLTTSGHDGILPFTLASVAGGLPGVPTDLTQSQLNSIGWLVQNGDASTGAQHLGAYQVAIWTVEYGNNFSYDSLGGTFANDVTNLIIASSQGPSNFSLNFLEPLDPSVSQTLVYGTPGIPTQTGTVPEPSTWAMGLIGFAALGALARFRHRGMSVA